VLKNVVAGEMPLSQLVDPLSVMNEYIGVVSIPAAVTLDGASVTETVTVAVVGM